MPQQAMIAAPTLHRAVATDEKQFVLPPLALAFVALWVVPMFTSMGLDESGNYWVIQGGLAESFVRSKIWVGSSWILNVLIIAARNLGGDSEAVLRLPTLLFATATLPLLYLLGKRLVGPLAAAYGCLVFVCLRDVVYVASVIRPYAAAVFFTTASTHFLVSWLDSGRKRDGILYTICSAGLIHAHLMFGPILLVHFLYYWTRLRSADPVPVRPKQVLTAWVAVAISTAALIPDMLALNARRNVNFVYLGSPDTTELLSSVSPALIAGSVALALLGCAAIGKAPVRDYKLPPCNGQFLALWILIPIGSLFLCSTLTSMHVFAERYYLGSAPAIALSVGAAIQGFAQESVRRTVASTIVICAVLVFGVHERFYRGLHDWRSAAAAVREHVQGRNVPILAIPGFAEATSLRAVQEPAYQEVLYEPMFYYRTGGELIRLPIVLRPEGEEYLKHIIEDRLKTEKEFLLFGIDSFSTREYRSWLRGRTGPLGFASELLGTFGGIQVTAFKRIGPN